jgi:hypothetical protein
MIVSGLALREFRRRQRWVKRVIFAMWREVFKNVQIYRDLLLNGRVHE